MERIGSHYGFAYWGEHEGWGIAYSQHRDSEALERSNFRAMLAICEAEDDDAVTVESMSHWAVGWVEYILVRPDSAAWLAAEQARERLDDYPVLDDDDYSEEEYRESCESMAEFVRSELSSWGLDADSLGEYIASEYSFAGRELPGLTWTHWPRLDKDADRAYVARAIRAYRRDKRAA